MITHGAIEDIKVLCCPDGVLPAGDSFQILDVRDEGFLIRCLGPRAEGLHTVSPEELRSKSSVETGIPWRFYADALEKKKQFEAERKAERIRAKARQMSVSEQTVYGWLRDSGYDIDHIEESFAYQNHLQQERNKRAERNRTRKKARAADRVSHRTRLSSDPPMPHCVLDPECCAEVAVGYLSQSSRELLSLEFDRMRTWTEQAALGELPND